MLRPDERIAWDGFFAAQPNFADEDISSVGDAHQDPPDIICTTVSGRTLGVELTQWVNHAQVTRGKRRESIENSYLKVVRSEQEPRPDRIGWVWLFTSEKRVKPSDQAQFRHELFALLTMENAKSHPEWDELSGGPIDDFTGFPLLQKYQVGLWVFPSRKKTTPAGHAWVIFRPRGGAYTHEWMVEAAIDRIAAKIEHYEGRGLHEQHSLNELHLLCYYYDEALLHNTPIDGIGFGFRELTERVARVLATNHGVFDRIFIYNPYESPKVVRVYPAEDNSLTAAA